MHPWMSSSPTTRVWTMDNIPTILMMYSCKFKIRVKWQKGMESRKAHHPKLWVRTIQMVRIWMTLPHPGFKTMLLWPKLNGQWKGAKLTMWKQSRQMYRPIWMNFHKHCSTTIQIRMNKMPILQDSWLFPLAMRKNNTWIRSQSKKLKNYRKDNNFKRQLCIKIKNINNI